MHPTRPMYSSGGPVLRERAEFIAFLERRRDAQHDFSLAVEMFLKAAFPGTDSQAEVLGAKLFDALSIDVREQLDFIKDAPETEHGFGTPSFTAEDLIHANEYVQQHEAAMEAVEQSIESMPKESRGLLAPQVLMARNQLEDAIKQRDMIQRAIESQEDTKA